MNEFEREIINYIGQEKYDKITKVKVGIAGAGGLGSNCGFNLVRSGFKKFKIVDFDKVEMKNLNRQFYFMDQIGMYKVRALAANLKRINPDIDIEEKCEKLTAHNVKDYFEDCHVIVEAFDRVEYKKLLVKNYFSSGKLLVVGSGIAGYDDCDKMTVRRVHEKLYMVGDFATEVSEDFPPLSPRVNIAAAKQANIILKHVLENFHIDTK